jgi:hypothetical protein
MLFMPKLSVCGGREAIHRLKRKLFSKRRRKRLFEIVIRQMQLKPRSADFQGQPAGVPPGRHAVSGYKRVY